MSIAVRVSVWILGVLVIVSAAVAVLALMQKQTVQGQNQSLHNQIADDQSRMADVSNKAKQLQDNIDQLNTKVNQSQQDKNQIQGQVEDLKNKSDDLQKQVEQANSDRDDWKNRVSTITRERDDLMQKLRSRPSQIIYRTRVVHEAAAAGMPVSAPGQATPNIQVNFKGNDEYWATVLKQKASLQVELEKEKSDLDQAALQVVDLKKQNSDLGLQLKEVTNEKDEIVQKIKYGQDLADNLSIDLARSRNDQQAIDDRADKLKEQNLELLSEIRELSTNKLDLEKTVSRLTDEKDQMQRKLVETESVIQSRIDDIWKIKQGLDRKLAENAPTAPTASTGGSMELPPIIVNAPNGGQQAAPAPAQQQPPVPAASVSNGKTEGNIISINESNNFVIADLGQENSSISVGTPLKVYRNGNPIATLEVIQFRRDICAADIKDKSIELKVGDTVRFNG